MVGLGGHRTQWYQFEEWILVINWSKSVIFFFFFFPLKSPYYHSNSIHNCTSIQSWAQVDQSWIVPVQSIHMELSACKRKVQLMVSTAYLDLSGNPIRWWVMENGKRYAHHSVRLVSLGYLLLLLPLLHLLLLLPAAVWTTLQANHSHIHTSDNMDFRTHW